MGFPIRMIQLDNGTEFFNDGDRTRRVLGFRTPNEMVENYFKNVA